MERPLPAINQTEAVLDFSPLSVDPDHEPPNTHPNASDINYQEINFKELMQEVIETQKVRNQGHSVEIQVNIRKEGIFTSNKHHLQAVLTNLIATAIRSQSQAVIKPYVYINIYSSKKSASILIRDSTQLIREEASQIFNVLYRDATFTERLGFELYRVKETLSWLKGQIDVSFELEMGTEYRIHLPNLIH